MPDIHDWLRPRVRIIQIVALALPAGAFFATVIFVLMRAANPAPPMPQPILTVVGVVAMASMIVASNVLPRLIRETHLKRMAAGANATPDQLIGVCQSTTIVGLAMLEGAVFFCAIAYFVEGHVWLLFAILIGIALMALRVPTERTVIAWLDAAGDRIEELRAPK